MMDETNAIITIDPVEALLEAKRRADLVKTMKTDSVLISGIDYGIIPGTKKPSLLKPGAERLCSAFGFAPRFNTLNATEKWDADNPLFAYRYECVLVHTASGQTVASGIGSCNSMESKYRWRKLDRVCPECGEINIRRSNKPPRGAPQGTDPGWYCWKKTDGCGVNFAHDDVRITGQETGRVPNDDVFSIVNTIDKMAQKRALIAAVLIACNASGFFTQDVEDMPGFGTMENVVEGEVIEITSSPEPNPRRVGMVNPHEVAMDASATPFKQPQTVVHVGRNIPLSQSPQQAPTGNPLLEMKNAKKPADNPMMFRNWDLSALDCMYPDDEDGFHRRGTVAKLLNTDKIKTAYSIEQVTRVVCLHRAQKDFNFGASEITKIVLWAELETPENYQQIQQWITLWKRINEVATSEELLQTVLA